MYPYGTPDPTDPDGMRGLVLRGMDSDIWVNQRGERFHNEALRGGASGATALLAQDPPRCWSIIDAAMASRVTVSDPAYQTHGTPNREAIQGLLETSPSIARGATIADLATAADLNATALATAIAEYNAVIASGVPVDPVFGRPLAKLSRSRSRRSTQFSSFRWRARILAACAPTWTAASCGPTAQPSKVSSPRVSWRAWPAATSTAARARRDDARSEPVQRPNRRQDDARRQRACPARRRRARRARPVRRQGRRSTEAVHHQRRRHDVREIIAMGGAKLPSTLPGHFPRVARDGRHSSSRRVRRWPSLPRIATWIRGLEFAGEVLFEVSVRDLVTARSLTGPLSECQDEVS